ncbi:hypothetical protein [Cohnella panacarvi]|uniref:hypothetical protein n=1 Tax=Cohnella panacarvi TaxID=400776 RepID=UPI00047EEFC2|nr:hypothetical protein [Cohnella panacarvi]
MSAWLLLFRKEMLESARNFKWIWIPLVFLALGITNPITTYFMPEILQAGGVAAEAAKLIPTPTSEEIIVKSLSQYGTLGMLVFALSFMGIVAGERQSGSAIMVLVKPVSYGHYITSKWAAMTCITLAAVTLGQLGTGYYMNVLFDDNVYSEALVSGLVYALWLILLNSITLLLSCLMKAPAGIAFVSVAFAALLSLVTQLLGDAMRWSPSRLTAEAGRLVEDSGAGDDLWLLVLITAALIAILLTLATAASRRMLR